MKTNLEALKRSLAACLCAALSLPASPAFANRRVPAASPRASAVSIAAPAKLPSLAAPTALPTALVAAPELTLAPALAPGFNFLPAEAAIPAPRAAASLSSIELQPAAEAPAQAQEKPSLVAGLRQAAGRLDSAKVFDGVGILPRSEPRTDGVVLDRYPTGPQLRAVHWDRLEARQTRVGFVQRMLGARPASIPAVLPGSPRSADEVEAAVRALIAAEPRLFGGISPDSLTTLLAQRVEGREGLADAVYVNFQQHINGVPLEHSFLNLTVQFHDGQAVLTHSAAQIYPSVSVQTTDGLDEASRRTAAAARVGAREDELALMGRRIMYLDARWRTVELYHAKAKRLLAAVDVQDGSAFAWEPPRPTLSSSGSAVGRGVEFDPIKTGANLNNLALGHLEIKTSQGKTLHSDANGNFVVEADGDEPVTLTATLTGKFVAVKNQTGANLTATATAKPGQAFRLVFNPNGAKDTDVAQVNVYYHITKTHDYLESRGVSHANMNKQMPGNANLDDDCNAFYDYVSVNFFGASSRCNNTGFDTVIAHEYGHHWHMSAVRSANVALHAMLAAMSRGGISEGWGDILGMFQTKQPVVGEGFFKNQKDNNFIRHGKNTTRYTPGGEVHREGESWMGFAWKLYESLSLSLGEAKALALAEALILPVVFTGVSDIPKAIEQVLLRDTGKDGAAPHYNEIAAAAKAHGITIRAPRPAEAPSARRPSFWDWLAWTFGPAHPAGG